ncbi:MAG: prepilin-type N-terminal cleavage/methylation domain-containing protein [Alphaproteobacteria bacterium]|nr:prepilin-type N-terminal cleavage/methylation domain-containing protein [Alphaproteobacteria bacterium]
MTRGYGTTGGRILGARRNTGFTLVELAVVIFVVALLLGSIVVPLSSQVEQRQFADAQRQLQEIQEGLIGYALGQPAAALPCPDLTAPAGSYTPNDGIEDVDIATGACAAPEGNVPWVTLGMGISDPWGNRYRYRVTPGMAQRAPGTPFSLATPNGAMQVVCLASTEPVLPPPECTPGQLITEAANSANAVVAVILSHGPNGWGAINPITNAPNLPAGCSDVPTCGTISGNEKENGDADAFFVSRQPSPPMSKVGEFDDIVVSLSPHTLKHRMVAAGKLP